MVPNGPILTQLILDTISIEAYFTLQRRIDARGGFLGTHRIRRERAHVLQGYLPALPSSNTPGDLLILPTFSQTTHAAKKQRRLGFPSGSGVQLGGDGVQPARRRHAAQRWRRAAQRWQRAARRRRRAAWWRRRAARWRRRAAWRRRCAARQLFACSSFPCNTWHIRFLSGSSLPQLQALSLQLLLGIFVSCRCRDYPLF
jgi:hypothetical protein